MDGKNTGKPGLEDRLDAPVREGGRMMITDWTSWLAADRPHVFWGRHPRLRSVRAYLVGVRSGHYRGKIRAELKKRLGGRWRGMNRRIRECLHDSVFIVMDEVESRSGGQADHPGVVQMRIALNLIADDLGWNDEGGRQ